MEDCKSKILSFRKGAYILRIKYNNEREDLKQNLQMLQKSPLYQTMKASKHHLQGEASKCIHIYIYIYSQVKVHIGIFMALSSQESQGITLPC